MGKKYSKQFFGWERGTSFLITQLLTRPASDSISVFIEQFATGNFKFVTQFNYNGKLLVPTWLGCVWFSKNDYADFHISHTTLHDNSSRSEAIEREKKIK